MKFAKNITELIGNTPLLHLNKSSKETGANLFAKLENLNPGASVKDRLSLAMIKDAENMAAINNETVIIEPTSGNTGIGLAMVCASKGYSLIVTMPEAASVERRNIIKAYGATVELTPKEEGMRGAINKAMELKEKYGNGFIPQQFKNPSNVEMHKETTAKEIWNDTDGKIDIFIAGVGTGGTLTGVGEKLKELNPNVRTVAVEPSGSPVLSGGEAGKHKIQGIGAGFTPEILNKDIIDEIFTVEDDKAFEYGRLFTRKEAVFSGISSGAIYYAATEVAKREENQGKNIVLITCDTGERYLSTPLYNF